jgi:hypothetical protein
VPFEKSYGESFWQITQRRPVVEKLQQITTFKHAWTLEMTIGDLLERNRSNIVPEGRLL